MEPPVTEEITDIFSVPFEESPNVCIIFSASAWCRKSTATSTRIHFRSEDSLRTLLLVFRARGTLSGFKLDQRNSALPMVTLLLCSRHFLTTSRPTPPRPPVMRIWEFFLYRDSSGPEIRPENSILQDSKQIGEDFFFISILFESMNWVTVNAYPFCIETTSSIVSKVRRMPMHI